MKKFLFLVVAALGLIWIYYWYVRGINLLLEEDQTANLPAYTDFATRLPPKTRQPSWSEAARMPEARVNVAAAAIGNKIYVVGGMDGFAQATDAVEVFDTSANSWAKVQALPDKLYGVALVSLDGKLYAIGGLSGLAETPEASLYEYDPATNSWRTLRKMPKTLGASAAVVYRGKIHVFGGIGNLGPTDAHLIYDPAKDVWEQGEAMDSPRAGFAAALLGGKIYVAGGTKGSLTDAVSDVSFLDPETGVWEGTTHLPNKKADMAAIELSGKMYVFGGQTATLVFGKSESFDAAKQAWTALPVLPIARHGAGVAAANGRIFVIGGGQRPGFSVSDYNEVFTP